MPAYMRYFLHITKTKNVHANEIWGVQASERDPAQAI